jgi:4-hydroxyproline betaine 2-epimerase
VRIAETHVYQKDLPLGGKLYRMSEGSHAAINSTILEIVSTSRFTI